MLALKRKNEEIFSPAMLLFSHTSEPSYNNVTLIGTDDVIKPLLTGPVNCTLYFLLKRLLKATRSFAKAFEMPFCGAASQSSLEFAWVVI